MSLHDEVEHVAIPYRKEDGQWYVVRKIDRTTLIEKLATPAEVAEAIANAQAMLAALTAPMPKKGKHK